MKRIFYIAAGLIVVGVLLAAAVAVHEQHVEQAKAKAQNSLSELQIVKAVDAHNLQAVQDQLTAAQSSAAATQKALCTFIKTDTKPNIALPLQCQ